MALEDVAARLQPQLGEQTAPVLDAYRAAHPSAKPVELLALILSPRTDAIIEAERQFQAGAPVHLYWFGWRTPVLDGRPRAFHCADLPFVFDNTGRADTATGGGEAPKALAAKMADAWIAFARQGDPNHAGLPHWPRFEPEAGPVMIFDDRCRAVDDPDRRERRVLEAALKRQPGG
jgi:para-nitrobenzyl esterase